MKIVHILKLLLCLVMVLIFCLPGFSTATDMRIQLETILRIFERDIREAGIDREKRIFPTYEYLELDALNLMNRQISFHFYGWARRDFANSGFYLDDTEGELLYGYLRYTGSSNNFIVRLGRHYVFERALDEGLDGLLVKTDISPYFSVSAFGGQPVSLYGLDGHGGDATAGGRFAHHLGNSYELGLFYKYVASEGNRDEEEAGLDVSLILPGDVSVLGRSKWNRLTQGWAEHSYGTAFNILKVQVEPFLDYFEYEHFLINGDNSSNPFRFLAGTKETITAAGTDLIYSITPLVDVGVKFKHYDYERRRSSADYYTGLVTWQWEDLAEAGAELGFMDGDRSDNQYYLGRAYIYKNVAPGFVTSEFIYTHYQEEVMGEDQGFFFSLGVGRNFLEDNLEVKLSGDFSADPFFDSDFRCMVIVRYNFKYSNSPNAPE